jgi:Cu/Ag efflux protein CusF
VDFACLQPGHYEAGMKGAIQVARGKAIAEPGKTGEIKMTSHNDMSQGDVRKIDKDAGKITIQHGEIKNLAMPPMTMVFRVREPAMLKKVRLGDNVQFNAIIDSGALVVTDLQAIK